MIEKKEFTLSDLLITILQIIGAAVLLPLVILYLLLFAETRYSKLNGILSILRILPLFTVCSYNDDYIRARLSGEVPAWLLTWDDPMLVILGIYSTYQGFKMFVAFPEYFLDNRCHGIEKMRDEVDAEFRLMGWHGRNKIIKKRLK